MMTVVSHRWRWWSIGDDGTMENNDAIGAIVTIGSLMGHHSRHRYQCHHLINYGSPLPIEAMTPLDRHCHQYWTAISIAGIWCFWKMQGSTGIPVTPGWRQKICRDCCRDLYELGKNSIIESWFTGDFKHRLTIAHLTRVPMARILICFDHFIVHLILY
jgi:hypothetical protein